MEGICEQNSLPHRSLSACAAKDPISSVNDPGCAFWGRIDDMNCIVCVELTKFTLRLIRNEHR
jgi:hypothetical protein